MLRFLLVALSYEIVILLSSIYLAGMQCLANIGEECCSFSYYKWLLLAGQSEKLIMSNTQKQLMQTHWDISKLLALGVNAELIQQLSAQEIRDLLKGLLYLKARYAEILTQIK